MARDVRLTFEPELTSSLDSNPRVTDPGKLKPLSEGISNLPPGKRVDVLFDIFTQREPASYPDVYKVQVDFYAPALNETIHDDSVLDLGVYRNVLHANRRDVHDLVAEVEKIRKALPPPKGRSGRKAAPGAPQLRPSRPSSPAV